ncbi:MAG: hypothetical protein ACRC8S_11650 [Fimbriiglobus sp.]
MTTTPDEPPLAKPRYGLKIVLFMIPIMTVPVLLIFVLFPFLMEQPFESAADVKPENIASIRVHILNRKEFDGGEDIAPYFADEADFATLLTPLLNVPETSNFPDARGPWLGEYRILTKNGRKDTIRLYWSKPRPSALPETATLRFQIGKNKFEGGSVLAVINAAKTAEARGRKNR